MDACTGWLAAASTCGCLAVLLLLYLVGLEIDPDERNGGAL